MKRIAALLTALGTLLLPAAASASTTHTLSGKITSVSAYGFTVQTGGQTMGVVNAMIRTATKLGAADWPYVYAGGHAQAGVASVGMPGNGYNGRRKGFDCSGSVAAVLAGGGLWPALGGVPSDAGMIQELRQQHLIARGVGTGAGAVNLWDDWGVHIFMSINGRFFGTSDGGGGGPKGGPAWLNDGAPDTFSRAYKAYHFLPSVLHTRTSYGQSYAFTADSNPAVLAGAEVGQKVKVTYTVARNGSLNAVAIAYSGVSTASGTVTAIAGDGSSITIQPPSGTPITVSTAGTSLSDLQVGDGVSVTYTRNGTQLLARTITITSSPAAGTPPSSSSSPSSPSPSSNQPWSYPGNGAPGPSAAS